MGLFSNIFSNNNTPNALNQNTEKWIINAILSVEQAAKPLGIYSCSIQIINGNCIQIYIQDYYDGLISKCGKEHGLDNYFHLNPVNGYDDLYTSKITPHIDGNSAKFMQNLYNTLKTQYQINYSYDTKLKILSKTFQ